MAFTKKEGGGFTKKSKGFRKKEDLTTWQEDIQGAGTSILDGLLLGFGDEAAAGLGAGLEQLLYDNADFGKSYERLLANQRDVQSRFQEQNPNIALGLELAPAVLTGMGVAKGVATGATRGVNALKQGVAGATEASVYSMGQSEKDGFVARANDIDPVMTALGAVGGAAGGALMRGTSAQSRTLGELADAGVEKLGKAATTTAMTAKAVGDDIANVVERAGMRVAPETTQGAVKMLGELSDVTTDAATNMWKKSAPARKEALDKFDRLFQPVKDFAVKRVDKEYGMRINRGSINGQRVVNEVDDLFDSTGMHEVREAAESNELLRAAMSDMANSNLKQNQRNLAMGVVQRELGPELSQKFATFINKQEDLLDRFAPHTQSVKRTKGYMSIMPVREGKESIADMNLRQARLASERTGKLSVSDASANEKMRVARLSADGRGLSKVGETAKIENPVDSHYQWMRTHATQAEMNKALKIPGATTEEELAEVATGGYYGRKLREVLEAKGITDPNKLDDAVEIYDQVVHGSQRAMAQEFQAVRNLGYATTIGNPYGAMLQAHDLFNAAYKNGSREVWEALAKKNGFDITMDDVGMGKQIYNEIVMASKSGDKSLTETGLAEWAANRSQKLLDFSMEKSLFAKGDRAAKGKIISSALGRELKDITANQAKWRDKWKYTFDADELVELEAALKKKDTKNELVKQLGLINLSDLQPISPASSTLTQLSKPNARILYMLKGFAMTQLQLVRNQVARNLKEGGRKEALKDMMAYFIISGGGYGVVNETRQIAKLQSPDYGNVPAQAFYQMMGVGTLGAFGGNQYGAHKFMQDPGAALKDAFVPPTPWFDGPAKDIAQLMSGKDAYPDKTLESLPIIGPIFRGLFDYAE